MSFKDSTAMDTAQPTKEMERRKRSEEALNKYCPRCNSKHTKFCYYNNYSLTQPRYLCKTCRRYWTHGGSLRTIPVGGASRKNKTTTRTCSKNKPFLPPPLSLEKGDQVLASSQGSSSKSCPSPTAMAFPNASSSLSGLSLRYELIKPAFDFSLGDPLNQEEVSIALTNTSERLLLPFEILKPPSSSPSSSNSGVEYNHRRRNSDDLTHDKEEEEADRSGGFWTDVFGGESWQL